MKSCWKIRRRLSLLTLVTVGVFAAQIRPQVSREASRQVFLRQFAAAALERTQHAVRYDPAYIHLAYPGGDVPAGSGVCTDEVIRAYRALSIDLQKEVHEDMAANFAAYPRKWGRQDPDPNIDHHRVPNLRVFFSRKGEILPITNRADDYAPGELVTWDLGGGLTHIGMVVDRRTLFTPRFTIVHNIGDGPKLEDVLFNWKITGHYRYFGPAGNAGSNEGTAGKTIGHS
jgi:uncharacterized protein YijF (DUF1287 family)